MRKPKTIQIWTIRNKSGQSMGRYQAYTADQAMNRFMDTQYQHASMFKNTTVFPRQDFTASVETPVT